MKKQFLFVLCTLLLSLTAMQLNAQVISFSMTDEASNQNTPAGWTAVQLPTGLPTFTTDNTFYITSYGASMSSADNTAAIQAALDAAAAAGGGMVVVPTGTYLTSYLQIGSKTVLHLCAGATLKMKAIDTYPTDANGYHKMENPLITGKSGASDIVIEGESRETSIIDGQGASWWDEVEAAKNTECAKYHYHHRKERQRQQRHSSRHYHQESCIFGCRPFSQYRRFPHLDAVCQYLRLRDRYRRRQCSD